MVSLLFFFFFYITSYIFSTSDGFYSASMLINLLDGLSSDAPVAWSRLCYYLGHVLRILPFPMQLRFLHNYIRYFLSFIITGIFNCWNTRLYSSWSSIKERVQLGMWLVSFSEIKDDSRLTGCPYTWPWNSYWICNLVSLCCS